MASEYLANGQSRRDRRSKKQRQERQERQERQQLQARRELAKVEHRLGRELVPPQLARCRQCGQVYPLATSPEPTRCAWCCRTIWLPAVRSGLGDGTPAA